MLCAIPGNHARLASSWFRNGREVVTKVHQAFNCKIESKAGAVMWRASLKWQMYIDFLALTRT
jgi:hypothetical protein